MSNQALEREQLAAMLLRLRGLDVTGNALLTAIESIPRRIFLSPEFKNTVYSSQMFPIACGGFCESVDTLARLLQQLDVQSHHKILEVGCGSGYSGAVLSRLGEKVLTVDRYKNHVTLANEKYEQIGATNVIAKHADGLQGVEGEGTFDRIFVSASFKDMPRHFVEFLTSSGVMIAPLSLGNGTAKMVRLTKIGSRFEREDLFEVYDSPLLEGLAAAL
ncbi:protein-L-isoaspartate(D-aspartate) O-methyltransferase [Lentilitoribacter sp. Alg239-R112]|uniref:protein-L-isoaspartate(D-aspartate) O-methyltransferase n=1 Tax=Lentilitoribacter sp. Alg239-R112 TaxID=2305987 RepID=UPI0013A6A8B5|nr:protein-L-isoaspartate(D-aspartate) O-methyltransferase [Lentilitoribacter sp. Alg239-R112]